MLFLEQNFAFKGLPFEPVCLHTFSKDALIFQVAKQNVWHIPKNSKGGLCCFEPLVLDIHKNKDQNVRSIQDQHTHLSLPPNPPQSHLFLSLLSAQNVEESTRALLQELDTVMCGLEWHIRQWKTHQLHTCVSRKPEGSQEKEPTYVENM